jgi:hypothetical protein
MLKYCIDKPCQYSETNVMQFLFNLLRINASACFEHYLLILKRRLTTDTWYICVRVMSVGCNRIGVELVSPTVLLQPTDITPTQYTKCHLFSASWWWANNGRNMQRPLILNKLNKKCITLVSLYWYTMMHGQQNIKKPCQFPSIFFTLYFSRFTQIFTLRVCIWDKSLLNEWG